MAHEDEDSALLRMQMNELCHRLRNHLQNMISLISLQICRARSAEAIVRRIDDLYDPGCASRDIQAEAADAAASFSFKL